MASSTPNCKNEMEAPNCKNEMERENLLSAALA
jgi:hypothetical protein